MEFGYQHAGRKKEKRIWLVFSLSEVLQRGNIMHGTRRSCWFQLRLGVRIFQGYMGKWGDILLLLVSAKGSKFMVILVFSLKKRKNNFTRK